MLRYDELENRRSIESKFHCAICGRNLFKISDLDENRRYWVCRKCRVIRTYKDYSEDE